MSPQLLRCAPWIVRSLQSHGDTRDLTAVRAELESGHAQLFAGERCAVVTVMDVTADGPIATYWIVGGDLAEAKAISPGIEAFARALGCVQVRFAPERAGWLRVGRAFGFRELWPGVLGKDL